MTNRTDKIVSEAIRQFDESPDSFICLSTGIILVPVQVPNMIFPEISSRFKKPKPPRVFIENIGREEENESDPEYIDALNQYQTDFTKVIIDTMIILGTKIHYVPNSMYLPDNDEWIGKIKLLNLDPGEDKNLRYLYWVKFYAAPLDKDIQDIMEKVGRMSGVAESDVQSSVEQFRDNT